MERVDLADAAAHLADLVDRASNGEDIQIVVQGGVKARLVAARGLVSPENPQPFDWDAVREMTDAMTPQSESAGDFFRRMRNEAPY